MKTGSNKALFRLFKIVYRALIALFLSFLLTILCVIYIPSIFSMTMDLGLEMLPKKRFPYVQALNSEQIASKWSLDNQSVDDEQLFDQLRDLFPTSRNKSTFFARIIVMHDYPEPCEYTIVGKHRTMDIGWQVQGKRRVTAKDIEHKEKHGGHSKLSDACIARVKSQ